MVTMERSRQGVTLLQFSRVIPSSAWLRASILWADDLAAVWPMPEPAPLSHAHPRATAAGSMVLAECWPL